MTRRCILHLGLHKTATGTIQKSFQGYDDGALRYADLTIDNHSRPLQMLFCDKYRHTQDDKLPKTHFYGMSRVALQDGLDRQLAQNDRDLLFSGEELSLSFQPDDIERLIAYLRPHFNTIQAIAYLREPMELMRSGYQQAIRTSFAPLNPEKRFIHFAKRLQPWEDALGRENTTYALFDRAALTGDDIVSDLSARIGVNAPASLMGTTNSSLSSDAFAVLYAFRKSQAAAGIKPQLPIERPAISRLLRHKSAPFHFSNSLWGDVLQTYGDDIRWAEDRLGRSFPEAVVPGADSVVFEREADILDHAARTRGRMKLWAPRVTAPFSARQKMLKKIISARV